MFTKRFTRESEKKYESEKDYEEPAKRGRKGQRGNTFLLAQFNPGAAREAGASESERINGEEKRSRSGTTGDAESTFTKSHSGETSWRSIITDQRRGVA